MCTDVPCYDAHALLLLPYYCTAGAAAYVFTDTVYSDARATRYSSGVSAPRHNERAGTLAALLPAVRATRNV